MPRPKNYTAARQFAREQAYRFAKIGACRAFDLPYRETAVLVGCAVSSIEIWMKPDNHGQQIREFEAFVRSLMPPLDEQSVEQIDNDKEYIASLRKRMGNLVAVLDRALHVRDIRVALDAAKEINKVLGFGQNLTVKHKGKVEHEHVHEHIVPPGLLSTVNAPRLRRGVAQLTAGAGAPTETSDDGRG